MNFRTFRLLGTTAALIITAATLPACTAGTRYHYTPAGHAQDEIANGEATCKAQIVVLHDGKTRQQLIEQCPQHDLSHSHADRDGPTF